MNRTILVVCHANTARSVMAQALLERMLVERGAAGVVVRSAGVAPWARDGMLPSLDARLALRAHGIRLTEDAVRSTALAAHPELLEEASIVVAMTDEQRAFVTALRPAAPVMTLRELAGESGDITDPAGQGEERFMAIGVEIRRCLECGLDRLLTALAT